MRSRPWRPRGPWLDNRAGARRRGRRADELEAAVSDELQVSDGMALTGVEDVETDDVLLSDVPAWPISQPMPAAWGVDEHASHLAPNESSHDRAPQQIDQLAEAVAAAHMLLSRSDDGASSPSSSRQSA